MPRTEAQKRAANNYRKKRVKRVGVDYVRRDFERLAAAASSSGLPVNTFIKIAIDEKIDRDGLREIADGAAAEFDAQEVAAKRKEAKEK